MAEEGKITEAPKSPPTQKGKFLRSVRGKIKAAGEWVNEGFQDPPGYKRPEPLSFKSVGKLPKSAGELIDKALGSEESTKASKNFLQRWRGRLDAIKRNRVESLELETEEQRRARELGFFDVFNKENVDIERLIDLRDAIMSGLLGGLLGTYWRPTIKGEAILKLREKRLRRQNK